MTDEQTPSADSTTVVGRWADVMADLQALAKGDRAQAGQTSFNFRGIDAVMNALGPVLRKHRVVVVPMVKQHWREEFASRNGGRMMGTVVHVEYVIRADVEDEDEIILGSAFGEASDAGDKSMPKAMSVAYRTFLLQALTLPTNEPDPDLHIVERGQPEPVKPDQPDITPDTQAAIADLVEQMGLSTDALRAGIAARAGRDAPLADLTEPEGQRVLLAMQRKAQSMAAAPDDEAAEAAVSRATGRGQAAQEPTDG
jgi:hypothetical protein